MVLGVIGPTNCSTLAAVLRAFTAHTTCAVPMTTSHAPATIARTTIELIGRAITTTPATALSTPAKMCQPRSGNSLRCAHQPEGGPRITALDSRDVLGGLGVSRWSRICSSATARVIWDTHAPVIMFRNSPASSAAASAGFASATSVVSGFCFRWRAFVRLVCDFRRVAMVLAHEWLGNAERVDFPKWRRQTIGRCA